MLHHPYIPKIRNNESNEWILIRLFLAMGIALFSVVPSVYLSQQGIPDNVIGYLISAVSFLTLLSSFFLPYLLERFHQVWTFTIALILSIVVYLAMTLHTAAWYFLILYTAMSLLSFFRISIEEIQFRDVTKKQDYADKRGLVNALLNIMWIFMPFFGGVMLEHYGFDAIFLLTAVLFTFSLIAILILRPREHHKHRNHLDRFAWENLRNYFRSRQLVLAFLMHFALGFWYAFIFIFIPLFILNNNYSPFYVGVALTATQVPLVFMQLKIGHFTKRYGLRTLFSVTFGVLAFLSVLLFLFSESILAVITLLFLTGVVVAFLEVIPMIYFFHLVTGKQEETTYPIFHAAVKVASIIGTLGLGALLVFLTTTQLFLVMALSMGIFFGISRHLKNFHT